MEFEERKKVAKLWYGLNLQQFYEVPRRFLPFCCYERCLEQAPRYSTSKNECERDEVFFFLCSLLGSLVATEFCSTLVLIFDRHQIKKHTLAHFWCAQLWSKDSWECLLTSKRLGEKQRRRIRRFLISGNEVIRLK